MIKRGTFLLQLLVSIIFLYIAFRNIHVNEVKQAFKNVNFTMVLLGTILQFISFFVKGRRWQALLIPIKPVRYSTAFHVLSVSYAANNLLPFRAGDLLRAVMIGQKENVSKVSSFSTVLLEKILDGLTVILFLIGGLLFLHLDSDWSIRTIVLLAFIFVGALLFLYVMKRYRQQVITIFTSIINKFAGNKFGQLTENILKKFLISLDLINSRHMVFTFIWTSIVIWSLEASLYVLVAYAFGQTLMISLLIGVITVAIVNLGIIVPSSPGYVGTFEFFCIFSLSLFGIEPDIAASYSIIVHLAMYIPITVFGTILWLYKPFIQKVEERAI